MATSLLSNPPEELNCKEQQKAVQDFRLAIYYQSIASNRRQNPKYKPSYLFINRTGTTLRDVRNRMRYILNIDRPTEIYDANMVSYILDCNYQIERYYKDNKPIFIFSNKKDY